ncbi:MAG: nuclease, partial [Bacteroidetes bacterium]
MERYVYKELENWAIRSRRKPLIIRGARQVGKTWLVENLARVEFDYLMKVDFEESPELISLFEGDLNTQSICAELELRTGVDMEEGMSLLFLDEIQLCPRAIISLRYFYEQIPGLHVIAAGSLLEFAFGEISFPVGRIQSLEVNPMNFSEFLLATGHAKAAEICSNPVVEVSVAIHNFLLGLLREYWMVGGMPESIQ